MVHAVHLAALLVLAPRSAVRGEGRPVAGRRAGTGPGRDERAGTVQRLHRAGGGPGTGDAAECGLRVVVGAARGELDLAELLLLLVVMLLSYLV